MSNAETPAGNTGGTTATSTAGALADLPDRTRVHALAKLLGTSSREVLAKLAELGETARSPHSGVPKDVALKVAAALGLPAEADEPKVVDSGARRAHTTGSSDTGAADEKAPEAPEAAEPPPAPKLVHAPPVHTPVFAAPSPVFLPPEPVAGEPESPKQQKQQKQPKQQKPAEPEAVGTDDELAQHPGDDTDHADDADGSETDAGGRRRRRRGRRGRGRGRGGEDTYTEEQHQDGAAPVEEPEDKDKAEPTQQTDGEPEQVSKPDEGGDSDTEESETSSRRRRRRRRRKTGDDDGAENATTDDPPNTVVHVRDAKTEAKTDTKVDTKTDTKTESRDGVRSVRGSTRLEAKRQRRRDGREAGRRRAPILSEAEFLARRESVERTMVVAERGDSTQIGVLEDGVLVEHFVTSADSGSIVGNVYLGRVQNVLPSMEAAFIDIGRGRNAVLYAGEVDWDAAGLEGKARKIEQALSTGDNVLVQVTKDPVGHKGARLTTQISLPGRFLVYVPAGGATGISRKLPENERRRLKDILKRIVPEDAGVIIRTASEGISEEELARDVRRLKAQWEIIREKADSAAGNGKKSSGPVLLYEEPDLLVKVVRDLFTEDFTKLEVQGSTAGETIQAYVEHVAPDLTDRLKRYVGTGDVFADYRIDEQLAKALDRKVWLPSGGYLVIDRTEAMTVIDVNTGKFTGSGGNLEETVTRNNLESAEEIVRQLRLRDIGGIIVIDFIDMVLESNRELVLRRLTECLGRDRTRHQVAEVTSLGLVQMTRKRVGTGLLEAFSSVCEYCKGRGVIISTEPQRGDGGGAGVGHQHTSRRSRGKGKADQQEAARAPEKAQAGPTPEQRESVVSAVQVMANASKAAVDKSGEAEREQQASRPLNGQVPDDRAAFAQDDDAATASVAGEPERSETPTPEPEPRPEPIPDAAPESASGAAAEPASEPEYAPAAPATRRRPRRAATRPAGPPVHAQEDG